MRYEKERISNAKVLPNSIIIKMHNSCDKIIYELHNLFCGIRECGLNSPWFNLEAQKNRHPVEIRDSIPVGMFGR